MLDFIKYYILMSNPADTYQLGIAITIIVLNAISMIFLLFVLGVYIVNWKHIASFPMRLVIT